MSTKLPPAFTRMASLSLVGRELEVGPIFLPFWIAPAALTGPALDQLAFESAKPPKTVRIGRPRAVVVSAHVSARDLNWAPALSLRCSTFEQVARRSAQRAELGDDDDVAGLDGPYCGRFPQNVIVLTRCL